jgi:hypothetical protein
MVYFDLIDELRQERCFTISCAGIYQDELLVGIFLEQLREPVALYGVGFEVRRLEFSSYDHIYMTAHIRI